LFSDGLQRDPALAEPTLHFFYRSIGRYIIVPGQASDEVVWRRADIAVTDTKAALALRAGNGRWTGCSCPPGRERVRPAAWYDARHRTGERV